MGKVDFTPVQKKIIEEFAENKDLSKKFYFTGGTALSVFYFGHRYSDDLDFFSESLLPVNEVTAFAEKISKIFKTTYRFTEINNARLFEFEKNGKTLIKVDFVSFPYKRIQPGKKYKGVEVDSLLDIAANKLITICERTNVKDYVDIYYLIKKKFTAWDIMYAVEKKFNRETDIFFLSSDFLKAENFEFLPKMILPLSLKELKDFYKSQAKILASKVTE